MLTVDEPLNITHSEVFNTSVLNHPIEVMDCYLKVQIFATVRMAVLMSFLAVIAR